eukprot:UN21366
MNSHQILKALKELEKSNLIKQLKIEGDRRKRYVASLYYSQTVEATVDTSWSNRIQLQILNYCDDVGLKGVPITDLYNYLRGKKRMLEMHDTKTAATLEHIKECVIGSICEGKLEPVRSQVPERDFHGRGKRKITEMIGTDDKVRTP